MKSAKIHGPDGGYTQSPNKRQWRRTVWRRLHEFVTQHACRPAAEVDVALMPSLEGDEIEVAEARGFRQTRMHVIDQSPAVVATLRRRYPHLRATYGVRVHRAFWRMEPNSILAANLDFTGCLSPALCEELVWIVASNALAEKSAIVVTILRGRESVMFPFIKEKASDEFFETPGLKLVTERPRGTDIGRVTVLSRCLSRAGHAVFNIGFGTYPSSAGSQSLLWAQFELHRGCTCAWCQRYWRTRDPKPAVRRLGDDLELLECESS